MCPRLFTPCLNPVAWRLRATEGYWLSKPIEVKVTDLLYIDDLKVFAASESKLKRVLKENGIRKLLSGTREEGRSPSAGRIWYEDGRDNYHQVSWGRKTLQIPRGARNVRQDERLALACAAKEYLRRISIIWSSPLSDCNRVQATNQYALPVLRYLMWTQHWTLSELRDVDRAARKGVDR